MNPISKRSWLLLLLVMPAFLFCGLWLRDQAYTGWMQAGILVVLCFWLLLWSRLLRQSEDHPLRTLSSLLSSLREGDYAIQARVGDAKPALVEVFMELNALIDLLRAQRLDTVEASALLQKMLDAMDVMVMAFDSSDVLVWANPAAASWIPEEDALGKHATALQLAPLLEGKDIQTLELRLGGRLGRWGIRRASFREKGKRHQLVVVSDLSKALREEERLAWKRLIRVMGHELNNSLAPIVSIAESLESMMNQDRSAPIATSDFIKGLQVIHSRATALRRFVDAYGSLARLPEPALRAASLSDLVRKCTAMESRMTVVLGHGPECTVRMDPDQVEQLLINLISNAVESCLIRQQEAAHDGPASAYHPKVECGWECDAGEAILYVRDNGIGIQDDSNLFVPFFTTKPKGSGIGLALCRQIAEGHEAVLTLENVNDGQGCLASLRLGLAPM